MAAAADPTAAALKVLVTAMATLASEMVVMVVGLGRLVAAAQREAGAAAEAR